MRVWGLFTILLPFCAEGIEDYYSSCGCSISTNIYCAPEIRILESNPFKESSQSDFRWRNEPIIAYKNTTIVAECSYMNPIQWHVDLKRPSAKDVLEIRQERSFGDFKDESTYCYKTTLTIISMDADLIGKYICETSENTNKHSSFQLYLAGKKELDVPFYLQAGTSSQITSHKLEYKLMLPCPVSRPSSKFYLQKYNGREFQSVHVATHIPYSGFELTNKEEKSLEGKYRCVVKNEEHLPTSFVQIEVVNSDFYYFPRLSSISTKDSLTVKCSSTEPVKLEIDQQKGLKEHNVTYLVEPMTIYPYTAILDYQFREHSPSEGTIKCVQEKSRHVLNEWKYQKMNKENGITFDYENNRIVCKSTYLNEIPTVSLKFCPSTALCHLYRKFFHSKDYTNTEDLKTSSCGQNCQKISATDFSVIGSYVIRCSFAKFTFLQTFFIGLDGKIYTTTESAPMKALVQIEGETEITLGQKLTAQCKWLTNVAVDLNVWLLERKNGQMEIIDSKFFNNHDDHGALVSNLEYPIAKNDYDIQAIHCYVGMRNSSRWMNSSHYRYLSSNMQVAEASPLTDSQSFASNLLRTSYNIEDGSCPFPSFDKENSKSQFESYNMTIINFLLVIIVLCIVNTTILVHMLYSNRKKCL